jgi:hypothetical protein
MPKSKRAKELIPKTAKECEVTEELATDVVNFYYTKLRKKMEALEDYRIGVPVLGTFTISKAKLKRSIDKLTHILTDKSQVNFDRIKKYTLTQSKLDIQKALLVKIEDDEKERERRKKDMEQQSTDT